MADFNRQNSPPDFTRRDILANCLKLGNVRHPNASLTSHLGNGALGLTRSDEAHVANSFLNSDPQYALTAAISAIDRVVAVRRENPPQAPAA